MKLATLTVWPHANTMQFSFTSEQLPVLKQAHLKFMTSQRVGAETPSWRPHLYFSFVLSHAYQAPSHGVSGAAGTIKERCTDKTKIALLFSVLSTCT